MTIKEMETRTGMARANIRYYEAEGLIHPERKENGYRVYTEAEAEELLKIRLLRSLDVSIEMLKELQSGNRSLEDALQQILAEQARKQRQLERAGEVTQLMLREKETYGAMNASFYLQRLESEAVLRQDRVPSLNLPWRRFWARDLDMMVCGFLVGIVFPGERSQAMTLLLTLLTLVLLEPLCLQLFATTPGKAIFGIRVTDADGGRLSYSAAIQRTCCVLWEGECMRIPLVSMYFHYRSYQAAEAGEELPWEADSDLTFQDDKVWRFGLYILVWLGILASEVLVVLLQEGFL